MIFKPYTREAIYGAVALGWPRPKIHKMIAELEGWDADLTKLLGDSLQVSEVIDEAISLIHHRGY